MENEVQIREVIDKVLSEEGLKNFIKIFEKEHNLFRGSHDKMAVPPVIKENYYTTEYLNKRLWEVDGNNIYYDDGWVGIGKKPTVPLDILGACKIDGSGLAGSFVVNSSNRYIDIRKIANGGTNHTATLTEGSYTGEELAAEIETQLEATSGTSYTFTISYSAATGKFTLEGQYDYNIRWKTGDHGSDNADDHVGTLIGFDDSEDDTGEDTYVSDEEVLLATTLEIIGDTKLDGKVTIADGGSISLQEDITFTGATGVNLIKFPDNLPDAFSFKEGANSYLTFTTTDGSEVVTFGENVYVNISTVITSDSHVANDTLLTINPPSASSAHYYSAFHVADYQANFITNPGYWIIGAWGEGRNSGTAILENIAGAWYRSNNTSSGTVNDSYGMVGQSRNSGTGDITRGYGVVGAARNQSSGTITDAVGVLGDIINAHADGTIVNAYNIRAMVPYTNVGTIDNLYGVYVDDQSPTGGGTIGNKWAFYQAGVGDKSYFAGNVGIGTLDAGQTTFAGSTLADDARGLSSIFTLSANPAKSDGIAFYSEGHIGAITTDGPTYGAGAWLNIDSGAIIGGDVRALDIGVYERDADCRGGNAYGLAIHLDFDNVNPPAAIYPFRINCEITGATPDALIFAPNKEALGLVIGDPGTADDAYLKIVLQDGSVYRIPLVKE